MAIDWNAVEKYATHVARLAAILCPCLRRRTTRHRLRLLAVNG